MSNVRRKSIIEALISRLEEVTVENGYVHTLCKVTTNLKNYTELGSQDLPALFILPDTETQSGGVGGRYQRTLVLDLFIVMKDVEHIDVLDIIDDIEECLVGVSGSRAGLDCTINVPRVVDWALDGQMNTERDGYVLAIMTIELDYIRSSHRPS